MGTTAAPAPVRLRNPVRNRLKVKPGAQSALAKDTVRSLAGGIPRFQVAVPANFDTWNPADYTPLVAYTPEGVDDTTLETITAYDATGKVYQLDAQVPPKQPVIVLGVNERTDDTGALLTQVTAPGGPTRTTTRASTTTATSGPDTPTWGARRVTWSSSGWSATEAT